MSRRFVFAGLVLTGLLLWPGAGGARDSLRPPRQIIHVSTPIVSIEGNKQALKFACLPKEVEPDEVLVNGRGGKKDITVAGKLRAINARCRNGKLVDSRRREIRFFRPSCWGNPPPDHLEIQQRENNELAKLKRRYNVIVFTCNPMMQ